MDAATISPNPGDGALRNLSPSSASFASNIPDTSAPSHPSLPSSNISNPPSPPLRRIVSSASELPSKEIRVAVFSQHAASDHYVEHHRKAMEALHQAHRHERTAWDVERQELHAKIAELEAKIRRLQSVAIDGMNLSSIEDKLQSYSMAGSKTVSRSASTPGDFAGTSRQPSISGFVFKPTGSNDRGKKTMQPITEEKESDRTKSVSFAAGGLLDTDVNKQLEGYTIPGHLIDKNLDGIAIKATSLPTATKRAILADSKSGTPSPAYSPSPQGTVAESPSLKRPVILEIPSTHEVVQLRVKDLYTHAAGNTPLARLADDDDDDDENDGSGTGGATPKGRPAVHTAEKERPPLEPYPSTFDSKPLRPPNERSDSYFNVPVPASNESGDGEKKKVDPVILETDEDPALKGPLTMPSHPPPPRNEHAMEGNSNNFLDKLSEKLTTLSRERSGTGGENPPVGANETDNNNDVPLRFKSSMNFGSQLGHGPK